MRASSCTLGLCVAFASCSDEGAAPVASGAVWFVEDAHDRGLDFEHRSGASGALWMPEIMCGGVALFDAEGDGDLDIYCVQAGGLSEPSEHGNQLYLNDGSGRFTNASATSGADDRGYGNGVATGDYDGDGDVDLYVTNYGTNVLLRNDGGGTFSDASAASGVAHPGWGTSCGFFDYDLDGDLDLWVCNYLDWSPAVELECFNTMGGADYCNPRNYMAPQADVLYRNDGDGHFTDVSRELGLSAAAGTGLGLVLHDFNQDGWTDAFVANDGMGDQLWINEGGERFVDRAAEFGCALDQNGRAAAGMGVTVADIDADGDLDLMVCNLRNEPDSVFRNEGGERFTNTTATAGLAAVSRKYTRFGMAWVDFDHDGRLDLYQANGRVMRQNDVYGDDPYAEPNLLFRGGAQGRFELVEPLGGTAQPLYGASRAAAFGDVDGDGATDVVVVNRDGRCELLLNRVPARGNWIELDIVTDRGAPALGAVVRARTGPRKVRADIMTASSYQAANSPTLHLGLGANDALRDVRVVWPNGVERTFERLASGQRHRIAPSGEPSAR